MLGFGLFSSHIPYLIILAAYVMSYITFSLFNVDVEKYFPFLKETTSSTIEFRAEITTDDDLAYYDDSVNTKKEFVAFSISYHSFSLYEKISDKWPKKYTTPLFRGDAFFILFSRPPPFSC